MDKIGINDKILIKNPRMRKDDSLLSKTDASIMR